MAKIELTGNKEVIADLREENRKLKKANAALKSELLLLKKRQSDDGKASERKHKEELEQAMTMGTRW